MNCITHHFACDCREARMREIIERMARSIDRLAVPWTNETHHAMRLAKQFLAEPWPGKKDERIKE